MSHSDNIIEVRNLTKVFPGIKALDDVSFSVKKGEIHALLGENGAGKSTLLNILHGVYNDYEGNIYFNGEKCEFNNAHEAINAGISKVHQEVSLIPELTIAQNIVLGYEPIKGIFIDEKKMYNKANELLKSLNCKFDSKLLAGELSTGEMQMVAIAKALYHDAQVISLDEPTASLSRNEIESLYEVLFNLKNKGITLIYVSHKLDEVFKLCDSATILRDGKFINTVKISDITERELIKLMVGRDVSAFAVRQRPQLQTTEVVLEVENLTKNGVFNDISFYLKKGEILGLSGLVGSKRTDVVRALFGADHYDEGTIKINGHTVKINSCMDGLKAGIGLIPEDRKRQGFLKNFNNSDNIAITTVPKFSKNGLINEKLKLENAQHFIDKLNLNPKNAEYLTKDLSGGNQQKVVLAKWLSSDVDIIILDEPTKGVDIGAKYEIYKILEELVMNGKSIIMVSSELPEIIGLCDRVIVMREGLIMKELVNENLDEEILLQYAMGVNENVS